jgi:unsaturated rhamnogalacturonyl hydrolase
MKFALLLVVFFSAAALGQMLPVARQATTTAMERVWIDSPNGKGIPPKWIYDFGTELSGIRTLWYTTGEKRYFDLIKHGVDAFVNDDGTIKTYKLDDSNLDQVRMGSAVLMMYRVTGEPKYKKAADLIRSQLKNQPRTNEGGFWHKKIYPSQMWLDGLYMAEPFYAEYSATFGENNWDDIANQFISAEKHTRDDKTGLLYHAWDESKQMAWADKKSGHAPMFWGRAMGWYAMALVDVLDYFPQDNAKRAELIAILNREMAALAKVQDKKSGLWWLILDKPGKDKNYLEASASCMFAYAYVKGVRMGYLPDKYEQNARDAWAGIQKEFLRPGDGGLDLIKTIGGAGLGGTPYRDGSYDYYTGEKVVTNDPKGLGALILASVEMENLGNASIGRGKTVMLDNWFNHELKKDDNGREITWHYTWDEMSNGGFSIWGNGFERAGARIKTLRVAPTESGLATADVYIIVDPDTPAETPRPNFISPNDIDAITAWVKRGGVLVLMANDKGNCEFEHLNRLAAKFGIRFNEDSLNKVQGTQFEQGRVDIAAGNAVFATARKTYLKEISTIAVTPPATSLVTKDGSVVIATANFGKGAVFAVGDPWLYNEYTDGRKLPADFDNFKAMEDLTRWTLTRSKGH